MAKRKPITFEITEAGCKVCTSHTPNKDGYIRLFISDTATPRMQFLHRTTWEAVNGPIPDGYEINHKCKNRACSNIDHLECIPGKDHTVLTNKGRYKERKDKAREYWIEHKCKGVELAKLFGVTFSQACFWVRELKKEGY